MRKPTLLYKSPQGATIHSYDLTGGKTTYERFLGCLEGSCEFYGTLQEAKSAILHQPNDYYR